ncbi:hypothetical protein KL930_000432 [Ogataea haglerorum]|uniref:Translation initiation factor IF2/IF5 domain-containing protein n=1 Tax=Ogataea haglerorum TaxID=1937702 RepID=A0ABQ7RDD3_9ASCO|nr:uncharacterized protein KL911_000699 [Ogataea haglerorum]KAG7693419.1 hypothetical protein KL951_004440 [Ogataea haglerorum]KAG7701115.1 hypothetical protein KL915_000146 [Ogataea haglerorum]KAG7705979.1 hypothetical protein KL950_003555 [Ogataea haglerorum]KAG7709073.1 hypothetical protein KL914_001463 [Ogataea haglerorum]KAG7741368.1 hypothetical protein KL932_002655 [Ogataea haglerorum]
MSEDLGFDPSLKKKKKVKSKADAEEATAPSEENLDEMFSSLKKKKKKTKETDTPEPVDELVDGLEGLKLKKKKKKSTKSSEADDFDKQLEKAGIHADDQSSSSTEQLQQSQSQDSLSNTVLAYENLLSRFYSILKEKNPELAGGQQTKLKIPPPEVAREGNKKTMFANVQTIASVLQRNPEHLIQYLFAELGTSGSIDGEKRLIIKGRFQAKNIESVLRRYIQEYVICKTCKSMNTELKRESTNRLHFIVCRACGSTKSVSSIKTGFQAHVGRRKRV